MWMTMFTVVLVAVVAAVAREKKLLEKTNSWQTFWPLSPLHDFVIMSSLTRFNLC
jgi:hypothetical protein